MGADFRRDASVYCRQIWRVLLNDFSNPSVSKAFGVVNFGETPVTNHQRKFALMP